MIRSERNIDMKTLIQKIGLMVAVILVASCGGPKDKAMLLQEWEYVFLPLDPETMKSMGGVTPDTAGSAKVSDVKFVYQYADSTFNDGKGPAIILYSSEIEVPPGSTFTKMRVWQAYEIIIQDEKAAGMHVNYNSSRKLPYTVSKPELKNALPKLPKPEKVKFNIMIKQQAGNSRGNPHPS